MRLALVTPLDPRSSGVAEYSLDLSPHLARAAGGSICVFSEDDAPPIAGDGWRRRPVSELPQLAAGLDLIIYQMGNSPAHDFMAPYLFAHPGLVVLHDLSLHEFYARQARAGRREPYLRAFGFGYGEEGTRRARSQLRQPAFVGYPDVLLSEWLAARSLGVVVHSRHAAGVLSARCPAARISIVPMPVPAPEPVPRAEARRQLDLPDETYLLAIFGVLNFSKNPLAVLDALARLRADGLPAQAVFIGQENSSFQLWPEVERRGLQADVIHLGFVADAQRARLWLSAADVAIGLRSLYWGETPSSALRALALGAPMIVNAVGAFDELPDAACIKLPPGAPAAALYAASLDLYRQPDRRRAMSLAARSYVMREHDPDRVARVYLRVVEEILVGGQLG